MLLMSRILGELAAVPSTHVLLMWMDWHGGDTAAITD